MLRNVSGMLQIGILRVDILRFGILGVGILGVGILGLCACLTPARAGEIGFEEEFALSPDRAAALKQLIPGTKDYYYYNALHLQNSGQFDRVESLLGQWIKRYKRTARVREIENRQALLLYGREPRATLDFLRGRLKLRFDHQRELMNRVRELPTELNQEMIGRAAMIARALRRDSKTLGGFEDRALGAALGLPLNASARRDLLSRLWRPDRPNLVSVVIDDLNAPHSRGFGSLGIHKRLLLSQLDECLRLKPELLNQTRFVNTYLSKLRPNPDDNWRQDTVSREAYFRRLWKFVSKLNMSGNSLKAHVLHHRLSHDQALGVYDRERFKTYLRLPRSTQYVNPDYMKDPIRRKYPVNFQADFRAQTSLPPIGLDDALVRSYFEHFFLDAESPAEFGDWVRDDYLRAVFAETKILAGRGDTERWFSMLDPSYLQTLKDRVEIDFDPTNPKVFGLGDQVALDIEIKNVPRLIVKVFEINTLNFYRENAREVDTTIDLDGLVAGSEQVLEYSEPALRRVRRHFEFPQIDRPGTYVIEIIGNGKSSRAVIRRGRLRYSLENTDAGHRFTVLDGSGKKLDSFGLWLGGHQFDSREDGSVLVPYSNRPGKRAIVLTHEGFAVLEHFDHQAESYELFAGIHIERESLLAGEKARVVIRPSLTVAGRPITLSVLENVTLTITTTDLDGIKASKEIREFEIFEDRESIYEFKVPERLASLRCVLSASTKNFSQNKKQDLAAVRSFQLNAIDKSDRIEDLHLGRTKDGYMLDLLGKSGEIKSGRPIHVAIKHRDFKRALEVAMQTNEGGRVELGALADIDWISARGPDGAQHHWALARDQRSLSRVIHGKAGETLRVPCMEMMGPVTRSSFSLIEVRDSIFIRDRFSSLSRRDGFLEIKNLPAGDYDLLLKGSGHRVQIRLTGGDRRDGRIVSDYRQLEIANEKPLQIREVVAFGEEIEVRLSNATEFTRVHLAATRYLPEYSAYENFSSVPQVDAAGVVQSEAETLYVVGRDIGDEYRYVLERQGATKFPGNMLQRPSLLLNPWAIRSTETGKQDVAPGGAYDRKSAPASRRNSSRGKTGKDAQQARKTGYSNLDYLGEGAAVLTNLRPDEKGVVKIPIDILGDGQHLQIIAVDPLSTVYRQISLEEKPSDFADLRLRSALDPKKQFTQRQQVSVVKKDARFVIDDVTTSSFEVYDSLDRVYSLLVTLSGDSTLVEFGFALRWPELAPEEKLAKYSQYACHELNFFLFKKDPEFFKNVIRPNIKNKFDKTFIDHWLLEADLGEYLEPWAFEQLNVVERILLAMRIEGESANTSRHVDDLWEHLTQDRENLQRIYFTALNGKALDLADNYKAAELRERFKNLDAGRASGAPGDKLRTLERLERNKDASVKLNFAARRGLAEKENRKRKRANVEWKMSEERAKSPAAYFDKGIQDKSRQLYRPLDRTKEWVENNYYHLPIQDQNAELITVNSFWRDFAHHEKGSFVSGNVPEASRNFAEMMLALSVLDLPFDAAKNESNTEGRKLMIKAGGDLIVFHREIREAGAAGPDGSILVSQNFYKHGDRYRQVGGEKIDKYVSDEFVVHTVYGCHVVVTNPTSSRQKLDILTQVPLGSIPVSGGRFTESREIVLEPYRTWTGEFAFYFPAAGVYEHYPIHVAKAEAHVASAAGVQLKVVERPTVIDSESWDYVSQQGSEQDVLDFLEKRNLERVPLARIAWRMRDAGLFGNVVRILRRRHVYDHTLWSYAIQHDRPADIREYLRHSVGFVAACGLYLESDILTIDPVERGTYEHREYWPLVNARSHRLGKKQQILNDRFFQEYRSLMSVLRYRSKLRSADLMSVTTFLLLQDRVEEAIGFFDRVRPAEIESRMQYDYASAYIGLYTEKLRSSRTLAAKYLEYPVERWRKLFGDVVKQIDEIEGNRPENLVKFPEADQENLAKTEPGLDLEVESGEVTLTYQNIAACRINYYLMDIELLFSRSPFVQQYASRFAYIRPNESRDLKLDTKTSSLSFKLPEKYRSSNILVEVVGAGQRKTRTYFSHSMDVQLIGNYAQLKVAHDDSGRPMTKVYVKVYANMKDGRVRFYKDGYTDLRGRFDYGSLSTSDLDQVRSFSILVLSEEHGATVREAQPPQA